MEVRSLGKTGLRTGVIGLGTVKLGRREGVKYAAPFDLPSDERVDELLRAAADLGVNVIDTAPAYGASERRIGEAMRRLSWLGGRSRWVVCTKVGETFEGGASAFDFSAAAVRASVERSRARLGVDVLDVVLIHSDGSDEEILSRGEAHGELIELRSEGKVRAWGMSAKHAAGGVAAVRAGADAVMVTINEEEPWGAAVAHAAGRAGVGVMVKKALRSGYTRDAGAAVRFALAAGDSGGAANTPEGAAVSTVVVGTLNPDHLAGLAAAADRE